MVQYWTRWQEQKADYVALSPVIWVFFGLAWECPSEFRRNDLRHMHHCMEEAYASAVAWVKGKPEYVELRPIVEVLIDRTGSASDYADLNSIYRSAVQLRDLAATTLGKAWLAQHVDDVALIRALATSSLPSSVGRV